MSFTEAYITIFRQLSDPRKTLDLSAAVQFFEDTSGRKILMDGPTDPLIEFLSMITIFSLADRVPLCPALAPPMNRFMRLCSFMSSINFKNPTMNAFLQPSHRSSIFRIELDGYFYNFARDVNTQESIV
jgi:hypothetical protein